MISAFQDSTSPGVGISTNSASVTKAPSINVIIEFTKPVFGFEATMVDVVGGRITRQVHTTDYLFVDLLLGMKKT